VFAVNVHILLDLVGFYIHELEVNGLLGAIDLIDVIEAFFREGGQMVTFFLLRQPCETELLYDMGKGCFVVCHLITSTFCVGTALALEFGYHGWHLLFEACCVV